MRLVFLTFFFTILQSIFSLLCSVFLNNKQPIVINTDWNWMVIMIIMLWLNKTVVYRDRTPNIGKSFWFESKLLITKMHSPS